MHIKDNLNTKVLYSCLLIISVIVFLSAYIVNPAFVSRHFSPDGEIAKAAVIKIYFLESFIILSGVVLFFYSLVGILKRDYAELINKKTLGYARKTEEKINTVLIFLKFHKKDDSLLLQRIIIAWNIFLLVLLVSGLIEVGFSWKQDRGFEYLWIAESLEAGHGFSFPFQVGLEAADTDIAEYFPTAHEEPAYPFLIAVASRVFGGYGRPVILALQVFSLYLTSIVIFHLARKVFNCTTGIVAGSLFPLLPGVKNLAVYAFGPPVFAGFMISMSAYLIISCLEHPSVRRGVLLGFILGLSCLLYAPILLFIPVSLLFLLVYKHPYDSLIGKTGLAILFTAVIVVSPWTIRNYLVFGHFIPLKTGMGIITYESNPIMASTFSSGSNACSDELGPFWKAKNAKEAVFMSGRRHNIISGRSRKCIALEAPPGFKQFNEAERDRVYLKKTLDFILSEPLTFAVLAFNRIHLFFSYKSIISVLFVTGVLFVLRNKESRLLILLVCVYVSVYVIIVPFWYRYRYPIEPILVIIASYLPALIISRSYAFLRRTPDIQQNVKT